MLIQCSILCHLPYSPTSPFLEVCCPCTSGQSVLLCHSCQVVLQSYISTLSAAAVLFHFLKQGRMWGGWLLNLGLMECHQYHSFPACKRLDYKPYNHLWSVELISVSCTFFILYLYFYSLRNDVQNLEYCNEQISCPREIKYLLTKAGKYKLQKYGLVITMWALDSGDLCLRQQSVLFLSFVKFLTLCLSLDLKMFPFFSKSFYIQVHDLF